MTLFNFFEETKEIETVTRYNGGWLKTVTGLDKTKTNGYSIIGEFTKAGNYKHEYKNGLYLDCSKGGSRKNQEFNYHLFRVDDDGFHLIQVFEDGGRNWACEFWENIEKELQTEKTEDSPQDILNKLSETYSDSEIEELRKFLNSRSEKKYLFAAKKVTQEEFEGYLKLHNIEKVTNTKFIEDYKKELLMRNDELTSEKLEELIKGARNGLVEQNALAFLCLKEVNKEAEEVEKIEVNSEWLTFKIDQFKFAKYYEYKPQHFVFAKASFSEKKLYIYEHILRQ